MEGNRVYLAACPDYGQAEAKLREAVAALGGMERFVRPGERILLKANLLRAAPPESAICTHPAVAAAAAKLVAEAGGTAVITDSPGGALHKEAVLRGLYEKTGMAQAAAASGAEPVSYTHLEYELSTLTGPVTLVVDEAPYPLTIQAEPGRIRIAESACPSQDCVHTGWISRAGQQIICLPDKLVISLSGSGSQEFDAISG